MAWLGTWENRIKITIAETVVDSALSNFPVALQISASSGTGADDLTAIFDELTSDANRKKIAVTTSNGTTQCYVEIELWDDANEEAVLHVKVPSISDSADTDLYIYFDSTQSDNDTYVGDTGDAVAQNVWDDDFVLVWHLAQDPDGDAADAILDSTSNGNDGTPNGTMTTADLVDGKIGKGIQTDGSDDYIEVLDNTSLDYEQGFSLEVVINFDSMSATDRWVFSKGGGWTRGGAYIIANSGQYQCGLTEEGVGGIAVNNSGFSASNDYHLAYDYDDANVRPYRNGAGQATTQASVIPHVNDYPVRLGSGDGPTAYPNAAIYSEARISKASRSAAWIKATYNTLFDSMVSYSAVESIIIVDVGVQALTLAVNASAPAIAIVLNAGAPQALSLALNSATPVILADMVASAQITGAAPEVAVSASAPRAEVTGATPTAEITRE